MYPNGQIAFDTLSQDLETFRKSLTDEQVEAFEATDLEELEVTIEAIQNKQRSDYRMRNLRRLEQFLKTIDSYCDFLSTCGYTDALELVAFIWVRQSIKNQKDPKALTTVIGPDEAYLRGWDNVSLDFRPLF